MMKYANYIILFLLLGTGILLKDHIHVSTNLLSLFATKESIEKLTIANNLGYSKEMLIAVKGFDKASKKKVRELRKKLQTLSSVKFVHSSVIPTAHMQAYYQHYYPLLASFDDTNKSREDVLAQLQRLYDAQSTNFFYSSINKNDPLGLFELESIKRSGISHKGDLITLGDYGYLLRVMTDVSASEMKEAKELYADVYAILSDYEDVVAFAPFFYTVENSTKIQADVQWIVALSTIILLLIYYLLIRNIKLLSHTLIALFSSMLFASLICTLFFENFHLLSLAFGMSLTAVSIDYLLHYHFHNFYETPQKIDKNVLYGFLTTIAAFGLFSFIPIPLIAQISFFALLSLSFAYILFTFVFAKLEIKRYEKSTKADLNKQTKKVPALIFFFLSILLFTYSAVNFKLDSNIRNLDYHNVKLQDAEKLFRENSSAKLFPVIVHAKTKDGLISNLHHVHEVLPNSFSLASFVLNKEKCFKKHEQLKAYDFAALNAMVNEAAEKIGFKKGYFKDAYHFASSLPPCKVPSLDIFQSYGLSIYQNEQEFYTIALVSDAREAQKFSFISSIDVKEMFNRSAEQMYDNLMLFGSVVLIVIFIMLFLSVKKRFLNAVNYILFPLGLTLAVLVSLGSINIMHLFSLIILIAIGIDYGIYMSNSEKPGNTMLAIKYSLLSTFAAFGVLIFSTIVALNSIGIVITLGCGAIFILIKVMK